MVERVSALRTKRVNKKEASKLREGSSCHCVKKKKGCPIKGVLFVRLSATKSDHDPREEEVIMRVNTLASLSSLLLILWQRILFVNPKLGNRGQGILIQISQVGGTSLFWSV